ncbi:hypothetical protein Acr_25g0005560 [Actinidia rufa]|uniref:Uncharacterized protein n=1 Tax=Actinidia rufa TaxID=165716 RepID=A0A7J0GZ87_9ERIC|nr:hypothetical protein Acr_25g0005560 [Actinidia rufa]
MVMSEGVVFLPPPSLPESFPIALHPELKQQFSQPRGGGPGGGRSGGRGRGTPRTGAIAEVESIPAALPDFKQLQLQIAQLQSHLGLATASQSSGPTTAIVAETPTALHDELIHPRPLPILEPPLSTPPPNGSLPPIASQDPGPRAQAPLPVSSPESAISPPLVSDIPPPRAKYSKKTNEIDGAGVLGDVVVVAVGLDEIGGARVVGEGESTSGATERGGEDAGVEMSQAAGD